MPEKPPAPREAFSGETYRAGPPRLGARLLAAASLVRPGRVAADIGCDHGKLAVHLVLSGRCPRVIGVDSRPLPLARARALALQAGCGSAGCSPGVECRLGDGLGPLAPGEAEEIIIAGLSGETIVGILEAAPWCRNPALGFVFVPASRAARLRSYLYAHGFALEQELPVEENRRVYAAMRAAYTGHPPETPAPLFRELGLIPTHPGPEAAAYSRRRLAYWKKRLAAPLPEPERAQAHRLCQDLASALATLEESSFSQETQKPTSSQN